MVSACHTKVVQEHLSFLKLFQWTVKRFVSRKVTEVCYTHSFSFHCISVPKAAGELRLLGMEIKEHFLHYLKTRWLYLSKHFSSSVLVVEPHIMCLRCNALFEVLKTAAETGRWEGIFVWLICWLCLCCWAHYYSVNCWQLSICLVTIPHGSTFALPSNSSLFCCYEDW